MKKVYICSSLKQENYESVNNLLPQLPHAIYLRPRPEELTALKKQDTVETDVAMIQYCDEIWVLGAYGRDCAWEVGYATGIGKIIRVLRDDKNKNHLDDDWMYLHGATKGLLFIYDSVNSFRLGCRNE